MRPKAALVLDRVLAASEFAAPVIFSLNFVFFYQGTLIEEEGSVQLTSLH